MGEINYDMHVLIKIDIMLHVAQQVILIVDRIYLMYYYYINYTNFDNPTKHFPEYNITYTKILYGSTLQLFKLNELLIIYL